MTHPVPFEGEPSGSEGYISGRDGAGVECAGWDLLRALLVQTQKHLVGTETTEMHILGGGGAGLCWPLSGGTWCHASANSGLRTPRWVEGPGQCCRFRARSIWGRSVGWHCSSRDRLIPEWWRDQGLHAAELCACAWLFEWEVEAIGDRLLEGQAR